jgi:hypothetical protein
MRGLSMQRWQWPKDVHGALLLGLVMWCGSGRQRRCDGRGVARSSEGRP